MFDPHGEPQPEILSIPYEPNSAVGYFARHRSLCRMHLGAYAIRVLWHGGIEFHKG